MVEPPSVALNVPNGDGDLPSARGKYSRGEYSHGKKGPQVAWMPQRALRLCGVAPATASVNFIIPLMSWEGEGT
jgi:hypothetical protein